jgi:hypothetical protein
MLANIREARLEGTLRLPGPRRRRREGHVAVLVRALRDGKGFPSPLAGEKTLEAVDKSPPDLVLLDMMMPRIDGTRRSPSRFSRSGPVAMVECLFPEQLDPFLPRQRLPAALAANVPQRRPSRAR